MKYVFNFPDIGEGITEGVIVEWKVKVGSTVKTGDPLVEMETDKVVTDIPSPRDGTITKTFGKEGETIDVDSPLVEIEIEAGPGESPSDEEESFGVVGTSAPAGKDDILPAGKDGVRKQPEANQSQESPSQEKVKATPVARNYAKQLGVSVNKVTGTGPNGRVTKSDILEYHNASRQSTAGLKSGTAPASGAQASTERTRVVQLSSTRKTIAKNMLNSTQSAAHISLFDETEISQLVQLRERYKHIFSEKNIHLTYLPFFLKALVHALSDYPVLNSEMDMENNRLIYKEYYNIGIAVDTDEGLVVPVIRDVDTKDISQIAMEIEEKAQKARERKLSLADFKDGTFTVTSYGSIGGLWGNAIINYPQAGILGIGRIHQQPVVKNAEVTVGTVLPVSLTIDHRIVDGGISSRFMNDFLAYVSSPVDMFIR
ncbi:MAG: 2-oxo acid dehydrogenase subunit E2 [Spirochaetaceae bacterium]|nr:2-oxo acid dehydrogenase subunit E2 [Spirochaetaceae bacterium]MCF7948468.1 2-oxo acid dehydrogenase subunit E2 [Spirochaetia bacterium]MCF7950924.1 2-oxo acid dehydrogenase subunit E2 [Spirochaetaceae bacterium]